LQQKIARIVFILPYLTGTLAENTGESSKKCDGGGFELTYLRTVREYRTNGAIAQLCATLLRVALGPGWKNLLSGTEKALTAGMNLLRSWKKSKRKKGDLNPRSPKPRASILTTELFPR